MPEGLLAQCCTKAYSMQLPIPCTVFSVYSLRWRIRGEFRGVPIIAILLLHSHWYCLQYCSDIATGTACNSAPTLPLVLSAISLRHNESNLSGTRNIRELKRRRSWATHVNRKWVFLYPQAVVLTNFRVKRHFKIECNKQYKTGWG